MTLSDAMRRGSRLRPQGFRSLFGPVSGPTGEVVLGSCALGAAWDAVGLPGYATVEPGLLLREFPELNYPRPNPCPACGFRAHRLSAAIIHLNDSERWPRERIASWIDEHPALFAAASNQIERADPRSDRLAGIPG